MIAAAISFLTSRIAGPLFGGLSLVLIVALGSSAIHGRVLSGEIDRLNDRIDNPKTGFAVRTAQCETNVATLDGALKNVQGDIQKLSDQTKAAGDAAAKAAAVSATEAHQARLRADQILALPRPAPMDACMAAGALLKGIAP